MLRFDKRAELRFRIDPAVSTTISRNCSWYMMEIPLVDLVPGREIWVRRTPASLGAVNIRFGEVTAAVPLSWLKVDQATGSGFGCRVRPAKDGEKPELTAFAIAVPASGAAASGEVSAQTADGTGFTRDVVVVQPRHGGLALGLALRPLIGWFGRRLGVRGAARLARRRMPSLTNVQNTGEPARAGEGLDLHFRRCPWMP